MAKTQNIVAQLVSVFNGPAWHGPSVLETLEKVKEQNANNSFKGSHDLAEIIAHMTAWRKFVIEHLNGNDAYEVSDELNFPESKNISDAIDQLKASQSLLIETILKFPEERLKEKVGNRPYTYQFMAYGIINHDLYHLGQIALLNR